MRVEHLFVLTNQLLLLTNLTPLLYCNQLVHVCDRVFVSGHLPKN
jgi:hypothetical protein